jgi:hypothetical protein
MTRRWRKWGIAALAAAAGLAAWRNPDILLGWLLLKHDRVIVEQAPDPYYEVLVPRYAELCATSQRRKKAGGGGNPFGHATLYLKGACLDTGADFPLLRRCTREATSVDDAEHGAGISVGRWFRNVNWVATPDHGLFYGGDLASGERLTAPHLAAAARRAIGLGVFKGVEVHDWTSDADQSLERFVTEESVATDLALQYGRTLFCSRVPVTATQIDELIAFLNDKNIEYATGAYDYNWSMLANNCVHTLRNALSAIHIWSPLSVLGIAARHVFNPATPANEFVNLAVLGGEGPLASPEAIVEASPLDSALLDFRWLPTRHGALVKTLPVHPVNDLFETDQRLFAVQSPLRLGATAAALRLLSDPAHVDFEANLRHTLDRYDAAIATRRAAKAGLVSVRGVATRRLDRVLLAYLRDARADAAAMLERLTALKAQHRS